MNSGNGMGSFIWGVLLGLGVGLYLNSEEGRKWRKSKIQMGSDLEEKIEKKVAEAMEKMRETVNTAATKVKDATETNGTKS
jgi:hypothetical protein